MSEESDYRDLLEKYLKDPTKKLLWSDESGGAKRYEFQTSVKDLPNEVRINTAFFYDDGEKVSMSRGTSKNQKFLCINGPLHGQKSTKENATDYFLFNYSTRQSGNEVIPSAVLIYRESLNF